VSSECPKIVKLQSLFEKTANKFPTFAAKNAVGKTLGQNGFLPLNIMDIGRQL
jgi:hypothetical protein